MGCQVGVWAAGQWARPAVLNTKALNLPASSLLRCNFRGGHGGPPLQLRPLHNFATNVEVPIDFRGYVSYENWVLHFLSQHLWLIAAGGGAGVAGRYLQLCIRHTHHLILPDPTVDLLRRYQLHGYNAHALVGITSGTRLWTSTDTDGAIAYNEFGKVWLVPGDPLASFENLAQLSDSFLKKARAEGRIVGFMPATERFAKQSRGLGLRAIKIGSAPYFDLTTWAPRGDRAKKARAGVNQARRAGVRVTHAVNVDEQLVRETACLCKSW